MKISGKFWSIFLLALCAFQHASYATTHRCQKNALESARKLLLLQTDNDERATVNDKVKLLKPITNPMNKKQFFDVLEVVGYVYKGSYRIRLIYAQVPNNCVLVGQEILELTSL